MKDPRPITATQASTVTHYTNDQSTVTRSTIPHDKTPHYSLYWESDTPYCNKIPNYSLCWESETPDNKISNAGKSYEVLHCKIFYKISVPVINWKPKKFQELSSQLVTKFFSHYSHPPYY